MIPKNRPPSHPGEILALEFLEPLGISQVEFARDIGVPIQRVNTIVNGKRGITAETALLFAKRLNTTPEFWMLLQNAWDLFEAAHHMKKRAA
jgi:antitoxin HigA-1